MRIGIDAMGGDQAPAVEIQGALAARKYLDDGDKIVLVGDEPTLRDLLQREEGWQETIEVRHATEIIAMDESPVEALRTKPDSSIAVLFKMHKVGEVDACISAGNTGACVASAQMQLRRLRGVHRPGIAILTPTFQGVVAICDVGANVNCRPQHLHQYGIMASVYIGAIYDVKNPRVGLMSVGEEESKGNELVKQSGDLLKADPNVNCIGNVEGRDLFSGVCDVVVCDGFVGNVVLKLMEGMATGVLRGVVKELIQAMPEQAKRVKLAAASILDKYDFNEYGGAPLLGVNGICLICHGASDHRGIKNAIRAALDLNKRQVNETIVQLLSASQGAVNG